VVQSDYYGDRVSRIKDLRGNVTVRQELLSPPSEILANRKRDGDTSQDDGFEKQKKGIKLK